MYAFDVFRGIFSYCESHYYVIFANSVVLGFWGTIWSIFNLFCSFYFFKWNLIQYTFRKYTHFFKRESGITGDFSENKKYFFDRKLTILDSWGIWRPEFWKTFVYKQSPSCLLSEYTFDIFQSISYLWDHL